MVGWEQVESNARKVGWKEIEERGKDCRSSKRQEGFAPASSEGKRTERGSADC